MAVHPAGDIKKGGIAAGGSRANLHNNVPGVTKLMQQCTSMLREKMWNDTHARPPPPAMRYRAGENGSGKPDNALEAMGPVLESVLGSLTQEYERRLMLKDQEIKQAKEQLQRAQEQAAAFEQQLASGGQRAQIEYQMTEEMKTEMENMRNQEVALQNQVLCLGIRCFDWRRFCFMSCHGSRVIAGTITNITAMSASVR